ncbi:hypothetical protein EVAR_59860_1 [Eumeta japonica]|uniref:Mariner Mos1 transposase n=1 Tax=Eumeta variegata TaxID=151549 RepID=A0A4C1Z9M1_EUMVA|nr:hypothetical protein EVAR_59860_1 [Eumeta japonica]
MDLLLHPKRKQQSMVWVYRDETKPTKAARERSASERMMTSLFNKTGHVATVALKICRTVNWCTTIYLPEVIDEHHKNNRKRRIILHHDNVSSHTDKQANKFLKKKNVELLSDPAYISDLAPGRTRPRACASTRVPITTTPDTKKITSDILQESNISLRDARMLLEEVDPNVYYVAKQTSTLSRARDDACARRHKRPRLYSIHHAAPAADAALMPNAGPSYCAGGRGNSARACSFEMLILQRGRMCMSVSLFYKYVVVVSSCISTHYWAAPFHNNFTSVEEISPDAGVIWIGSY